MPRLRTGSGIGPNGYVRVRKHCRILQHLLPFLPASSLPCCIIATRFFFLTPNFLYTQRIAGRDSDDIYREFSSDVCKLRMLHCEVEWGHVWIWNYRLLESTARAQTNRQHVTMATQLHQAGRCPWCWKQADLRKETEGEGCRSPEGCRQRKSAVSTWPDAINSLKHPLHRHIPHSWFIYKNYFVMKAWSKARVLAA